MQQMPTFISIFKRRNTDFNQGFTLIELLVAIAITGIIITLTGSGLFALMNANQRNQSETTDRLEIEQALAFISDEIKMSRQIAIDLPSELVNIANFTASGSRSTQPILILHPATSSKLTVPIIYYLADPPNQSVWLGPKVIYRWGPTLLQNGNYSDGKGKDITQPLANAEIEYYNEVLIDRISDQSPTPNLDCDPSYDPIPTTTPKSGFYACIAPDRKSVKLWIEKQPNSSGQSQSINALVVTRSN